MPAKAETPPPPRALPPRERALVLGALVLLAVLSWAWLLGMPSMGGAGGAGVMEGMAPRLGAWSAADAAAMFLMWAIMMVGMMVPSATPMVLLYARVARHGGPAFAGYARTAIFAGGYIAAWTVFSAAATAAQWGLESAALLTPMMRTGSAWLGGAILVAAGAYQFTPAKRACLDHCRGPFAFISLHWRRGAFGAFVMGVHHGLYCLGCCWMLMAILFVGGVMNLLWVALIAALVLIEKVAPQGALVARGAGLALIVAGLWLAAAGI